MLAHIEANLSTPIRNKDLAALVRQIKAALVEQAFFGTMRVSCPLGPIVAESRVEGATASDDPWLEALVPGGECQN